MYSWKSNVWQNAEWNVNLTNSTEAVSQIWQIDAINSQDCRFYQISQIDFWVRVWPFWNVFVEKKHFQEIQPFFGMAEQLLRNLTDLVFQAVFTCKNLRKPFLAELYKYLQCKKNLKNFCTQWVECNNGTAFENKQFEHQTLTPT